MQSDAFNDSRIRTVIAAVITSNLGAMRELGFEQVWDMGGIIDWEAGGFPVVS